MSALTDTQLEILRRLHDGRILFAPLIPDVFREVALLRDLNLVHWSPDSEMYELTGYGRAYLKQSTISTEGVNDLPNSMHGSQVRPGSSRDGGAGERPRGAAQQ